MHYVRALGLTRMGMCAPTDYIFRASSYLSSKIRQKNRIDVATKPVIA